MGQRSNVSRAMSAFRTDIKEILVESTLAGPLPGTMPSLLGTCEQRNWHPPSKLMPQIAVQRPVLDRLQEMRRLDRRTPGEIGDRARNLEDPIISPGAQMEFFHGMAQKFPALRSPVCNGS